MMIETRSVNLIGCARWLFDYEHVAVRAADHMLRHRAKMDVFQTRVPVR